MGGEMKVFLVLSLVILMAAAAFAYGRAEDAMLLATVAARTTSLAVTEPVTLMLSGGFLLVLAAAVRRLSV
jgi:hypothetical protein